MPTQSDSHLQLSSHKAVTVNTLPPDSQTSVSPRHSTGGGSRHELEGCDCRRTSADALRPTHPRTCVQEQHCCARQLPQSHVPVLPVRPLDVHARLQRMSARHLQHVAGHSRKKRWQAEALASCTATGHTAHHQTNNSTPRAALQAPCSPSDIYTHAQTHMNTHKKAGNQQHKRQPQPNSNEVATTQPYSHTHRSGDNTDDASATVSGDTLPAALPARTDSLTSCRMTSS